MLMAAEAAGARQDHRKPSAAESPAERRFAGDYHALPSRLSYAAPDRIIAGSRVPRAADVSGAAREPIRSAQDKSCEVRRGRIAQEHGKISALRRGAFLRPRLQFSASPWQNRSSLHLASGASVRATKRLALILHRAGHTSRCPPGPRHTCRRERNSSVV
jgi:hypothetical protein